MKIIIGNKKTILFLFDINKTWTCDINKTWTYDINKPFEINKTWAIKSNCKTHKIINCILEILFCRYLEMRDVSEIRAVCGVIRAARPNFDASGHVRPRFVAD